MEPAVLRIDGLMKRARKRGDRAAVKDLRKQKRGLPCYDPIDPNYRRLRYVRYADDWLLGFAGPKREAEEIKDRIAPAGNYNNSDPWQRAPGGHHLGITDHSE